MTSAKTPKGRTVEITYNDGGVVPSENYRQFQLKVGCVEVATYGYYTGGNLINALKKADEIIDLTELVNKGEAA